MKIRLTESYSAERYDTLEQFVSALKLWHKDIHFQTTYKQPGLVLYICKTVSFLGREFPRGRKGSLEMYDDFAQHDRIDKQFLISFLDVV